MVYLYCFVSIRSSAHSNLNKLTMGDNEEVYVNFEKSESKGECNIHKYRQYMAALFFLANLARLLVAFLILSNQIR